MADSNYCRHGQTAWIFAVWVVIALDSATCYAQGWPPPMPPEKAANVYGQEIHYYEEGAGPSVILLHGMVGTATDWALVINPLSKNHHVYALEQIGFGHSAKPLIEYKIATFVDFLQEFMRIQHIPKATVVGNSIGGWVAADFAATHPELVDRLVLVDASGLDAPVHHNVPVDMNPSSLQGMRKAWEFLFYNKGLVRDSMVRYSWERRLQDGDGYTIQRLVAGLIAGNQYEDSKLGSIRAPTLLIWGRDDEAAPLKVGERFQKAIPESRLVVIDQCGHVPQIEKPVDFNKALMEFLVRP